MTLIDFTTSYKYNDPYMIHIFFGGFHIAFSIYFYINIILYHTEFDMKSYFKYSTIIHTVLCSSSFIFYMSPFRNQKHIMVTTRQRLNACILTLRSLLCSMYFIYDYPHYYNYIVCFGTMILSDTIHYFYTDEYNIILSEYNSYFTMMDDVLQFHMIENSYTSYIPVITYQLQPFLITLVKHNYINVSQWNRLNYWNYSLNQTAWVTTGYEFAPLCYCVAWYMNFYKYENKYLCWSIIFLSHMIIKQGLSQIKVVPDDFQYYPCGYLVITLLYQLVISNKIT